MAVGTEKDAEKKDGRHERVERGKRAVFEALVELFGEGRYNPPVAAVAARAGVSERTLFRYFGSYNDVIAGMIGYFYPRVEKYFTAEPPAGDLRTRLLALAELRVEFSEVHGIVTRTSEALAHEWPAAAMARYGRVELLNQQLRAWIGDDMARVSDEKLVVLSALFDIPNMESMSAALGKRAAATVANAAMAIVETN
ncbi:MAG: TetR family transcriptional regulator [Ilumatobacteraceae bacterium]